MPTLYLKQRQAFDPDALVSKVFDMSAEPTWWIQPAKIAELVGLEPTRSASIHIGNWAAKRKLKLRKSNGVRLILMPPPNNVSTH